MWKACQKVLEKVEDLFEVRFVKFKSAIECVPVVFAEFEVEFFEVWSAAIHTLNHLVLEFEKSRVIERDPYMAGEGRGRVMTHGTKMKLKLCGLGKNGVDQNGLF
jgi:hypothetical protein